MRVRAQSVVGVNSVLIAQPANTRLAVYFYSAQYKKPKYDRIEIWCALGVDILRLMTVTFADRLLHNPILFNHQNPSVDGRRQFQRARYFKI